MARHCRGRTRVSQEPTTDKRSCSRLEDSGRSVIFFAIYEQVWLWIAHYLVGEAVANRPAGRSEGETGRVSFCSTSFGQEFWKGQEPGFAAKGTPCEFAPVCAWW